MVHKPFIRNDFWSGSVGGRLTSHDYLAKQSTLKRKSVLWDGFFVRLFCRCCSIHCHVSLTGFLGVHHLFENWTHWKMMICLCRDHPRCKQNSWHVGAFPISNCNPEMLQKTAIFTYTYHRSLSHSCWYINTWMSQKVSKWFVNGF